jgi:hypothetical protein
VTFEYNRDPTTNRLDGATMICARSPKSGWTVPTAVHDDETLRWALARTCCWP